MYKAFLATKIYPQKLYQINPKYHKIFFMNRSPIIQNEKKFKPHVHNANWPKDIRLLQDHLIPKSLSFFHAHNTTARLLKLTILHNLKLEGKKGSELTTQ